MKVSAEKYHGIVFEVHKKWWRRKKYHARIVGANGKIMFDSRPQYNKKDAHDSIHVVKREAQMAPINDITDEKD